MVQFPDPAQAGHYDFRMPNPSVRIDQPNWAGSIGGYFGGISANMLTGKLEGEALRAPLHRTTQVESDELYRLELTLKNLYEAMAVATNKSDIINAERQVIDTIKAIIGSIQYGSASPLIQQAINQKIQRVFSIPEEVRPERGQDAQEPYHPTINRYRNSLETILFGVTEHLAYLEGAPDHAISRVNLADLHQKLQNYIYFSNPDETQVGGFLHAVEKVRIESTGALSYGLNELMQAVTTAARRAVFQEVDAGLGTGLSNLPPFEYDDPFLPGREITGTNSEGHPIIVVHQHRAPPSAMDAIVSVISSYMGTGSESGRITQWRASLLLPILKFLKGQVETTYRETQASYAGGVPTPQVRNVLRNATTAGQTLESCIALLGEMEGIEDKGSLDYQERFEQIKDRLDRTLVGVLKYLPYISLSSILGGHPRAQDADEDPVEALQKELWRLEQVTTRTRAILDEKTEYEQAFGSIAKIASWRAAYAAVKWFIGEGVSGSKFNSFDLIMVKVYDFKTGTLIHPNPALQEAEFNQALVESLRSCQEMFFLKRWFLELFAPFIVNICSWGISRIADGAKKFTDAKIAGAHKPETGEASIGLLQVVTNVTHSYQNGISEYGRGSNSTLYDDREEAVERHFFKDPNRGFLRGHKNIASVTREFSLTLISQFMTNFDLTTTLNSASVSLLTWSTQSSYTIVQIFGWVITAPIRATMQIINTAILLPIEWVMNLVLNYVAKKIMTSTNLPEQVIESTVRALTSEIAQTSALDEIEVELLRMLWDMLKAPSDPHNSEFNRLTTSPKTTEQLATLLTSIFETINLSGAKTAHEIRQLRDGRSSDTLINQILMKTQSSAIDGLAQLLDRSYQLMLKRSHMLCRKALEVGERSIIESGRRLNQADIVAREEESEKTRRLKAHYLKLLLWESVRMATSHLTNPAEENTEIDDHICQIRANLDFTTEVLGDPAAAEPRAGIDTPPPDQSLSQLVRLERPDNLGHNYQSKLNIWHQKLLMLCTMDTRSPVLANPIGELQLIHDELTTFGNELQHRLATMEFEQKLGRSASDAHKADLMKVISAYKAFNTQFSVIYDFYIKFYQHRLPEAAHRVRIVNSRSREIETTLPTFFTNPGGRESWFKTCQEGLVILKTTHSELHALHATPGQLAGLVQTIHTSNTSLELAVEKALSYDKLESLCFNLEQIAHDPIRSTPTTVIGLEILTLARQEDWLALKNYFARKVIECRDFLPHWNNPNSQDARELDSLRTMFESIYKEVNTIGSERVTGSVQEHTTRILTALNEHKRTQGKTLLSEFRRAGSNLRIITQQTSVQAQSIDLVHQAQTDRMAHVRTEQRGPRRVQLLIDAYGLNRERPGIRGALHNLEKAVVGMSSVHKIAVSGVEKLPFMPAVQRNIFDYTNSQMDIFFRNLLNNSTFLRGVGYKIYIKFLEDHNVSYKADMRFPGDPPPPEGGWYNWFTSLIPGSSSAA